MESSMLDSWALERTNQRAYVSLNKAAAPHSKKWKTRAWGSGAALHLIYAPFNEQNGDGRGVCELVPCT